jgi:hypothetical protein
MAYTVHNILGPGLLEHAYREAMCVAVPVFIYSEIEKNRYGRPKPKIILELG